MAVDGVQNTTVAASRPQALSDVLHANIGKTIEARVAAMVSTNLARLIVAGQALDVATPQALPVGSTLALKVEQTDGGLRLVLQAPNRPATGAATQLPQSAQPPQQAATQRQAAAPASAAALSTTRDTAADPQTGATTRLAPNAGSDPNSAAALARNAATAATAMRFSPDMARLAAQLNGLDAAPLPATNTQLNAAVPAVLAGAGAEQTGEQNLHDSGMQMGTGPRAAPSGAPPSANAPPPAAELEGDQRITLAQVMRQSADKQQSLAPLFANLAALVDQARQGRRAALPPQLARAAEALLALRLDGDESVTAPGVKNAIASSGVFLESHLANWPLSDTSTPPADLKAALAALKQALGAMTPSGDDASPSSARGKAQPDPALHAATEPHDSAAPRHGDRPPSRSLAPQGQPPETPTITPATSDRDALDRLADQTDRAMARLMLSQAASLPDKRDHGLPHDQATSATLEIPVKLGDQTAIAQMLVTREREQNRAGAADASPRNWTVRFSIDAEPTGPVHAAVRYINGHIGVQLWAERRATATSFNAMMSDLQTALEANALTVDGLVVREGKPDPVLQSPAPVAAPTRLLDRSS